MTRIQAIRKYMFEKVLDDLLNTDNYKINVDFLDTEEDSYSLDKIPTSSTVQKFITGKKVKRDVYNFTSRKTYSADTIINLSNIGFFESLEEKIEENNAKGILPNIDGIESIECLNCGALSSATPSDCIFAIQIQITYKEV